MYESQPCALSLQPKYNLVVLHLVRQLDYVLIEAKEAVADDGHWE